jgi:hypothetical protein
MPDLLDRPKNTTPPPRRRRGFLSENEDVRSAQVGAMLTVVVWLLLVYLLAAALRHLGHTPPASAVTAKPTFEIELTPDEFALPEKAPPPDHFVETNPDAPENTPDKTRNFAARNQQVAQEKPDLEGKSDAPKLDGKKEGDVSQIVDGRLHEPQLPPPAPVPPQVPPAPQATEQANARKEQNPLTGEEKVEGDSPEGFGTAVSKETQNVTAVPEKITGEKDSPFVIGNPSATAPQVVQPQRPLPRPRVDRNVRPAVLVQNKFGTSNMGATAIDARWSQYGEYMQKLVETVQVQWDRILENSRVYPPSGTEVKVKFRIDGAEGAITEIIESSSTGGTQAERACQAAITARSPYGKWTEDMIAVLGQSQEITFTFYYH